MTSQTKNPALGRVWIRLRVF